MSISYKPTFYINHTHLSSFIDALFPIEGNLVNITCGHNVLRPYKDTDYLQCSQIHGYFGATFVISSPNEYGVVNWFSNHQEIARLRDEFSKLMTARLSSRLGKYYEEFSWRAGSETNINRGGCINILEWRSLSTIAHDVMYLADVEGALEAFKKGLLSATSSSAIAAQGHDADSGLCDNCTEREFVKAFGADVKTIIDHCPAMYRNRIINRLSSANSDLAEMIRRLNAPPQVQLPVPESIIPPPSIPDVSIHTALLEDVDIHAVEAENPAASVQEQEKEPSLFARLFCCCFGARKELSAQ